jgi:hypothetical protein
VLLAACLLCPWRAAAAEPNRSATIEVFRVRHNGLVEERSMGVLNFHDKTFPVKVHGLAPSEFQKSATIEVFNLRNLDDVEGLFLPAKESTPNGCCVLSNEYGVEIRFAGENNGGTVLLEKDGVSIEVAAESMETEHRLHGRVLPQSAGFGSRRVGPFLVTPTLNIQTAVFAEANNAWGGPAVPAHKSEFFYEQSNEEGLNASLNLGDYGIIVGRVSAIFSASGGLDAEATNLGNLFPYDYALESGYLEWDSGPLFPELGYDAISISGGPQSFPIADGFLFMQGANNGGSRGADWLNPRTAFRQTGIVSLRTHDILLQGFYLEPNYNPSTHTKLGGVNFQTPLGEYATIGFTYCNLFRSQVHHERGMNLFYGRVDATPVPAVPDFHFLGAFAAETNGQRVSGANGWYASPYYVFSKLPWSPTLYYRYASFTGGGANGNHNFDPLFYGSSDWGSWYQGEILGNWFVTNSNLITHQVRAEFSPSESTTLDVLFYKFMLYSREQELSNPPATPVTSKNLAEEIDLAFQYAPAPWWVIAATISTAIPDRAATQITGGAQTWVQSMLTTSFTF